MSTVLHIRTFLVDGLNLSAVFYTPDKILISYREKIKLLKLKQIFYTRLFIVFVCSRFRAQEERQLAEALSENTQALAIRAPLQRLPQWQRETDAQSGGQPYCLTGERNSLTDCFHHSICPGVEAREKHFFVIFEKLSVGEATSLTRTLRLPLGLQMIAKKTFYKILLSLRLSSIPLEQSQIFAALLWMIYYFKFNI